MLDLLRKKRRSMLIVLAFFIIIVVFVFWGVGPTGRKGEKSGEQTVARVDGVKISLKEYAGLYERELKFYKEALKDKFTEEFLANLDLKNKIIDALIDKTLILNAARKQGIKVAEREVQDKILKMPVFQKDGSFDKNLYFSILMRNRLNPADYESGVQEEMTIDKMRNSVLGAVSISDEEVLNAFKKQNRSISLSFIDVSPAHFAPVEVKDDEVKGYYEKNSASFMLPPKVKVLYAYVDKAALEKTLKVKKEEIKNYYDKNAGEFREPRMLKARHILIKPAAEVQDKAEALKAARIKAGDILERLKKGEDFATLARQYSQDPGSAKNGGDLGYFTIGTMVRPFEEAALKLKKGEISAVVGTDYGFHIIKADDIREERQIPFEDAKDRIERLFLREGVDKEVRVGLAALQSEFKSQDSVAEIKKAAAKNKATAVVTDFFTEKDAPPDIAKEEKVKDAVFMLDKGGVSGIIDTPQRFYIVKIMDEVRAHAAPFESVAGKIKEAIKKEKALELAKNAAEALLKKIQGGEDFKQIAGKGGYKAGETAFFSMSSATIPSIGASTTDREDLFELSSGRPDYPKVIEGNGSSYVVRLSKVKEADLKTFDKKISAVRERVLADKKNKALKDWLDGLRKEAAIEIKRELL